MIKQTTPPQSLSPATLESGLHPSIYCTHTHTIHIYRNEERIQNEGYGTEGFGMEGKGRKKRKGKKKERKAGHYVHIYIYNTHKHID